MPDVAIIGNKEEQKIFTECYRHYEIARDDLDNRILDFDKKDILFRSHIEASKWPYRAQVFDPRIFTSIFEKTSRMFANKPKGRLVPREGGDSLGAMINNELLSWQWDDNERVDNMPILAKWVLMDINARKYGASFAIAKWHYQRTKGGKTFFDGPNLRPLNNRDCLPNPSYSNIKFWFQHRDYVTLQELEQVNDIAHTQGARYRNLDILRQLLKEESKKGGDVRSYTIKNKSIKGLTDFLGQDELYKVVEIITEYREERWITFSPKHGIILRDIPNPYAHGQIPVIMLRYYPIDDDLYGLSEIEPIEKLQRALNAFICQNLDTLNMATYTPLKIRSTGGAVQMHTLEFGAGKKWLMNDPATDVIPFELKPSGLAEFPIVYRLITSAIQEGMGETSAGTSNLVPGSENKTATEVKDTAATRLARDNYNQIFLSEALKKQMLFWHTMNQQFLFADPNYQQKVIRIVGKDALKYFQEAGLDGEGFDDEGIEQMTDMVDEGINIEPNDLMKPIHPVEVNGEMIPKMVMEDNGQMGSLIIEPDDLAGNYDFIPDVESMQIPDKQQAIASLKQAIELALNPVSLQLLNMEQYRPKFKELLEDYFEQLGLKDAEKYFEKLEVNPLVNGQPGQESQGAFQRGEGGATPGQPRMDNGAVGRMEAGMQALPNGQTQPIVP